MGLSRRGLLATIATACSVAAGRLGSVAVAATGSPRLASPRTWTVFYGASTPLEAFAGYDVVVLDPGFSGDPALLKPSGAVTFGYLSLGEIRAASPLFAALPEPHKLLLDESPQWPGTHAVDVRQPGWRTFVLEQAIPGLLARGFNGLFYDTLDMPPHLEGTDPSRFGGMKAAAIGLVKEIRRAFPGVPVIMNRGYALLPEVIGDIDAVVAESLLASYDFAEKRYHWVDADTVARQLQLLRPARERRTPLPILSLDYWYPSDAATIRRIYKMERELGHVPYVSTILLDAVAREPD